MRTDAKIGFAIGAVLLAVLTVYAIVVPKKRTASPQGVAIVLPKGLSNAPSPFTPSNGGGVTDKAPDVTPTQLTPPPSGDTAMLPPTTVDPKPSVVTPPANPQIADASKSADGVDWAKLTGTPNALYSVTPAGGNTQPVSDTPVTNTSGAAPSPTPPADPQTFRPGGDVAVDPAQPKSSVSTGATHTRSTPARKSIRSHDPAVAVGVSHGGDQYVVEAGDTLSGIAAAHYGAAHYYTRIITANPSVDPNRMRPGTKLTLPDLSSAIAAAKTGDTTIGDLQSPNTSIHMDAERAAGGGVFTPGDGADTLFAASSNTAAESGGTYTVHAGDNLYRISKKLYGTSKMAHELFATNQDAIGADMSKLKLGMVLTLPEAPTN